MVKEPQKFWSFYKENISKQIFDESPAETAIRALLDKGVVKTVIDLNYTGSIYNNNEKIKCIFILFIFLSKKV